MAAHAQSNLVVQHNVGKGSRTIILGAGFLDEVKRMSIPSIPCSFACNKHPDAPRLKKEAHAWILGRFAHLPTARGSFSVDALTRSGFDELAMLTFPTGKACRMMPILKYLAWLFLFDTVLDDPLLVGADLSAADALFSSISGVLDGVHSSSPLFATDDPIFQVMTDTTREWWLELCQDLSSRQQARFAAYLKTYLEASRRQIQYRVSGCLPDLDTFLPLRVDAGAYLTCAVLVEYSLEIDFDEETMAHPLMAALNARAADHIDWANDLLSFKKEIGEDDLLNLVLVIHERNQQQGREHVALQDAADEVCAMIGQCDKEFVRIMAEVKASQLLMSKPGMAGYVEGLCNWMRGSLEWHMASGRYVK